MIGEGVIAESIISYRITWKNQGDGKFPIWKQEDQVVTFHSSNVYPDLLFSKAQGLATYYRYTTIDSLLKLFNEIDSVIDSKLNKNTEGQEGQPAPTNQYTVTVHGDRLNLIDVQSTEANVRIRHKVSDNLMRKIEGSDESNSSRIWLEVSGGIGSHKFSFEDFQMQDGRNLLVQALPTVDFVLQPGEKSVTPKSEKETDYEDKIKHLRAIRMNREEQRYARSKEEMDASMRKAQTKQPTV